MGDKPHQALPHHRAGSAGAGSTMSPTSKAIRLVVSTGILCLLLLHILSSPVHGHQHSGLSPVPSVRPSLLVTTHPSYNATLHSHRHDRHHHEHHHQHSRRRHRATQKSVETQIAFYQTSNKSINFTHIEYDAVSGSIYLGAVNWIYQLGSTDLHVERAVRTGPIRDSPSCAPADCSGVAESNLVIPTNNFNKVLLVEPYARMLIVCGSVHQGACSRHRLEDISIHEDLVPVPVASNDENSSTVAFIGPARYSGVQLTPIMYVGATNSKLGPYRDMVPAISGRSLQSDSRLFNIIEGGFSDSARVEISSHLRDYFLVRYVYGFYADEYIYFAQVQRRSYFLGQEESGHLTRLSRVCVSDPGFHTYTELTLECVHDPAGTSPNTGRAYHHSHHHRQSSSGHVEEFNLLQDAVLIKAGPDLADALGIERNGPVLVGVFAASIDHTQRVGSRSAVCLYPLTAIEQRFAENIHRCYNGSVYSRNMEYIAGSVSDCPKPGAGNVFNFCNEVVKLNGSLPLRAQAALTYRDGTILTSVAASVTGQHTVAFLGTNYGLVKKILLRSGTSAEQFDEMTVDANQPILADMFVDSELNARHLVAASPYKVVKLPVESCPTEYDTCEKCLQARNPYCGWCSLQKRCTIKSECLSGSGQSNSNGYYPTMSTALDLHSSSSSSSLFSTPRWLSLETAQCIDFHAIKPEFMPHNKVAQVELIINQLPALPYGKNYLCVFDGSAPIPATVTRTGLVCRTPDVLSRPAIAPDSDHVSVDLAVRSSETATDFIHRSFVFFDCAYHKSCKSCVTSSWNCNWCMHENACTSNTSQCARRVIVGENSPQNSLTKGASHCPSFVAEQSGILIPNGSKRQLSMEVRNLMPSQDTFQCIVEVEGAKQLVPARVQDNRIICNEIEFSYQEEIGEQNANLTIVWNGDTFLDKTNFVIYKCQFLGAISGRADCSLCGTRDPKYDCAWCHNTCSHRDQCRERPSTSCPPPRIDYIHPISGPIEGGTLVTIEGSNLGSSLDEIRDRVSIGGIRCIPTEYNVSLRVICRTGVSPIGEQSAIVMIGNRAGVTRAQAKFQYKSIELNDVNPKIGPQSGGTWIYLSGKNLNIGSNVAVLLDDMPCNVERALASSTQLSCRTSAAPYPSYVVSRLVLIIDGANFTLANPFLYTPDPTISRIEPLQSLFSGGRMLQVTGTQFSSIQQPRLMIFTRRNFRSNPTGPTAWPLRSTSASTAVSTVNSNAAESLNPKEIEKSIISQFARRLVNDSICTVVSSVKMFCPTPMINGNLELLAEKLKYAASISPSASTNFLFSSNNLSNNFHIPEQIYLQAGFVMDDTISVLELDSYYPHLDSNILYVNDPTLFSISNGHGGPTIPIGNGEEVLMFKAGHDVLLIEGENLASLALADGEMNITIGMGKCNLTSVSARQIVCNPPLYSPAPGDELGRRCLLDLPAIVLRIGNNYRKSLGYLHYGNYYSGIHHRNSLNGVDELDAENTRFYHFGYGSSGSSSSASGYFTLEVVIGLLIVAGIILAIISTIVLAAYKHKTTQAEREYKRIQLQMDTLENNVRSECKQAFAELQTDILQASGVFSMQELHRMVVPTHDERTHFLRMFFGPNLLAQQQQQLPLNQLNYAYGSLKDQHQQQHQIYNSSVSESSGYYSYFRSAYRSYGLSKSVMSLFWNTSQYFNTSPPNTRQTETEETKTMGVTGITAQYPASNGETLYGLSRQNSYLMGTLRNAYQIPPSINSSPNNAGTVYEQFSNQMLSNAAFVFSMVQALESQKTFTNTDRTHFASLLMLSMMDRMDVAFDVMRNLLAKHIEQLAMGKGNSLQTMMRSEGESIGEKMLCDWLTICLFKFTKEVSSTPLYLLNSAIKHQIDKGPVDFVTGNSRYSLSEERLLREQIEYKILTVSVIVDDKVKELFPIGALNRCSNSSSTDSTEQAISNDYNESVSGSASPSVGISCRILDCDTISQVKAKIIDTVYRSVRHSQRPTVPEVSLTWRCLKSKANPTSAPTTSTSASSSAVNGGVSSACDVPQPLVPPGTFCNIQPDIYGVASMMSKADADKIYNASRRSDVSLVTELVEVQLEDYDTSTQILTANEVIWRRLNTVAHYSIPDNAQFVLELTSSLSRSITSTNVRSKCNSRFNGQLPIPPNTATTAPSSGYDEDDFGPESDAYHLYESIPAHHPSNQNGHQAPNLLPTSIYGGVMQTNVGSGMESIYNLSIASSQGKRFSGNSLYYQGAPMMPNQIYQPQHQSYLPSPANMSQQRLMSPAHIYGTNAGTVKAKNMTRAMFARPSSYRVARHQPHVTPISRRRSFARNFYHRLSSLMNRKSDQQQAPQPQHKFGAAGKVYGMRNYFDVPPQQHPLEMDENSEIDDQYRHNVWHLVKPSSLFCENAVSLYDVDNNNKSKHRSTLSNRTNRSKPVRRCISKKIPAWHHSATLNPSQQQHQQQQQLMMMPSIRGSQMTLPHSASISSGVTSLLASFFGTADSMDSDEQQQQQIYGQPGQNTLSRSVPEIYLTRLLSTKGTIQQYMDDLLATIFDVNERLPIAIKWLFDFFDQQAHHIGMADAETCHLWKSNALVVRYWIALLRSPELLFDISSSVSSDVCLNVLANNLTEAATNSLLSEVSSDGSVTGATGTGVNGNTDTSNSQYDTKSPSSATADFPPEKLLFAKDIPVYRAMIKKYYRDIAVLPPVEETDILSYMRQISKSFEGKVCKDRVVGELFAYCVRYRDAIFNGLATNPITQRDHVHLQFETLAYQTGAAALQPPSTNNIPGNPTLSRLG